MAASADPRTMRSSPIRARGRWSRSPSLELLRSTLSCGAGCPRQEPESRSFRRGNDPQRSGLDGCGDGRLADDAAVDFDEPARLRLDADLARLRPVGVPVGARPRLVLA